MTVSQSAVPGIDWPALPPAAMANMLALQYQLRDSQWLGPDAIRTLQLRQADSVIRHACDTVPFWRERLGAIGYDPEEELDAGVFAAIPVLTRRDLQSNAQHFRSERLPPGHGPVREGKTSGSTGMPISFADTAITQFFWHAITARDHLWRRRDFSGRMAVIRSNMPQHVGTGWGPPWDEASAAGVIATLDIASDVDAQLDWIRRQDPHYLLTYPSNLVAIARRSLEIGARLPALREARTFGEILPDGLRQLCSEAWRVPLTDMYSAEEIGYIALQCPRYPHYHVQSETVLVEILTDTGEPCAPGEIGRIVLTSLNNFAMPLIRYEIGDYAQAGPPCPCGRGLPVVSRVMGRQRNMLTLPDGSRRWPAVRGAIEAWQDIAPLRQLRLVQHTPIAIEAQYVADRAVTPSEAPRLVGALKDRLGFAGEIALERVEQLPRGPNLKFEDFLSELPQ